MTHRRTFYKIVAEPDATGPRLFAFTATHTYNTLCIVSAPHPSPRPRSLIECWTAADGQWPPLFGVWPTAPPRGVSRLSGDTFRRSALIFRPRSPRPRQQVFVCRVCRSPLSGCSVLGPRHQAALRRPPRHADGSCPTGLDFGVCLSRLARINLTEKHATSERTRRHRARRMLRRTRRVSPWATSLLEHRLTLDASRRSWSIKLRSVTPCVSRDEP
jgi:hypothetical protein